MLNMKKLEDAFEHPRAHEILAVIVILNAIVLGLETSQMIKHSTIYPYLLWVDHIFLSVFVFEMLIKFCASGWRFFKSGWNIFDLLIILVSIIPFAGNFSILRAIRVLRVLWLIELFPKMKLIITSIRHALPGILNVASILLVIFYMAAVIVTNLFGHDHPELFGHMGTSMQTLFQLMLADDWGNIMNKVHQTHPHAYLFFIPFSIIVSFTVLNLFVGLIVNGMQQAAENQDETIDNALQEKKLDMILKEIKKIEKNNRFQKSSQ